MNESIFKTKRAGLIGGKPVGQDYMLSVSERAKRLRSAEKPKKTREDDKSNERQLLIPFK